MAGDMGAWRNKVTRGPAKPYDAGSSPAAPATVRWMIARGGWECFPSPEHGFPLLKPGAAAGYLRQVRSRPGCRLLLNCTAYGVHSPAVPPPPFRIGRA